MATILIEEQITEMQGKLDRIVDELDRQKHARSASEDLLTDLMLVAKDAYKDATGVCSSMEFRSEDIVQLFRVGLSNVKLLTVALEQLDSAADFIKDLQPVTRDLYQQAVAQLQVLQDRGWFNAAASGARIADSMVELHSAEDIKQIEASIPSLVGLLRELTRLDVLHALEEIAHGFGRVQATMNEDKSILQIGRDLASPEARQGFGILVEFLKVIGARNTEARRPSEQPAVK